MYNKLLPLTLLIGCTAAQPPPKPVLEIREQVPLTPPKTADMPSQQLSIQWTDVTQAEQTAIKQKRKIMMYIYADWCAYCQMMEQDTFSDKDIINILNDKFISVKLNADTIPDELLSRLLPSTAGFPTFIFFDSTDGHISPIAGISGFVNAAKFEVILNDQVQIQ